VTVWVLTVPTYEGEEVCGVYKDLDSVTVGVDRLVNERPNGKRKKHEQRVERWPFAEHIYQFDVGRNDLYIATEYEVL
jgi:hypothetical protein